eukprot:8876735-Pyramimonas_sp.AAC.1
MVSPQGDPSGPPGHDGRRKGVAGLRSSERCEFASREGGAERRTLPFLPSRWGSSGRRAAVTAGRDRKTGCWTH